MTEVAKDIEWFRRDIEPLLRGYEISYRYFEDGDFGSLNQVQFNSTKIGGNVDFWGLGWLGVFVLNYENEEQLVNILLKQDQEEEKEKILGELLSILQDA